MIAPLIASLALAAPTPAAWSGGPWDDIDPCDIPASILPHGTPEQETCNLAAWMGYRVCLTQRPEGYPPEQWCDYCAGLLWGGIYECMYGDEASTPPMTTLDMYVYISSRCPEFMFAWPTGPAPATWWGCNDSALAATCTVLRNGGTCEYAGWVYRRLYSQCE